MNKSRYLFVKELFPERNFNKIRLIAFIAIFSSLANVIAIFSFPVVLLGRSTGIHFIQIPILAASLGIGPIAGGLVGIIGAINMAFSPLTQNPFIILYNGILGFSSGTFYILFSKKGGNILIAQIFSILCGYIIQFPFIYSINTQIMNIPLIMVQIILIMILLEDILSIFIIHPILYRINFANYIQKAKRSFDEIN